MPERYANIVKRASAQTVSLGNTVTYTIEIENTNEHMLTNIAFYDSIPQGLLFQYGSVKINGNTNPNADPNAGLPLIEILPHGMTTVSFIAEAVAIPADNPTINTARITFNTHNNEGEPVYGVTEYSNPVSVRIGDDQCDEDSCEKNLCKIYSVSLPFTVKPFARREAPEIECYGQMTLVDGHVHCQNPRREFEYTLTQRIRVELPIAFGAEVCCGEPCAEDDGECTTP